VLLDQESDSQGWVLKALREAGNSIVRELSGIDEKVLNKRPAEGELCLKEIAAHMRDAEELANLQMQALIESKSKPIPVWDVDVLPMERDYRSYSLRKLLSEFTTMRRETTYLLWDIDERDWKKPGKHPYKREVTLEEIARALAQHDLEHLWQVRQMKYDLGIEDRTGGGGWVDF
jgi:DinB superfamily